MQMNIERTNTRGSALLVVVILISLVSGLGAALMGLDLQTSRSRQGDASAQRAFYAAEAAVNEALAALGSGAADPTLGTPAEVGTEATPRVLGPSRHWATITRVDLRRFLISGVGRDGDSVARHELLVSHAPTGFFQYAAFGGDGVRLDSNAFVDSYDSMFGAYATQIGAGTDWARQEAVVGSNADIRLMSNTRVYGDCRPGPGGVVVATAPGILVTGSTEPATTLVALDPMPAPAAVSLGAASWTTNITLGPGVIRYSDVLVNGGATLTIQGPAQLVVDNFVMKSGTRLVFDPANGPIELHSAHDFVLESNTEVVTQSDSAVDVKLFLSGDNRAANKSLRDAVSLSANSAFVGAIYAPNSSISLGSNFEIFGSVMAGILDLSSNGKIHFDEALLYDGSGVARLFALLLWRRMEHVGS
jgi:hypothetical protein